MNNISNNNNINNSQYSKIIDESDIVSVISQYVHLEKKGNDYKGLCPFHNDANPSLSVSPSKRVYKCFSCNEAGNVITFVQKIENISTFDAMKKVALMSGIQLDLKENPKEARNSKYYQIMKDAVKTYEFYLKNTNEGIEALKYLTNRNITDDIIKRFHIGLSSHKDDIITKVLIEQNKYLPIDLLELGLISNNQNKYQDLYHGRIMFPITDIRGNTIAFSGRIYDTKSNSKYINSKESTIFKKKEVLYNFFESLNDIKTLDQVFIFEGFMDVIAAYRGGIPNSIATMGTALTTDQINIITKVTKNIVLCYDGDTPGVNAMKRAISLFALKNITVKTVAMPEGLDPDDYINKYGKEAFYDLFTNHQISSFDYLYEVARRSLNVSDLNSIARFQTEIYDLARKANNLTIENYLIEKLSKTLNTSSAKLENDLKIYKNNNSFVEQIRNTNTSTKPTQRKSEVIKNIYEEAEKGIVYLSFINRDACIETKNSLEVEDYINKTNRNILYELYNYYGLAKEMNKEEFFNRLSPIQVNSLNTIINTCSFYTIDSLHDFIAYVKKANSYKDLLFLERKLENEINPEKKSDIIQDIALSKKSLIKIKK